MMLAKEKNENLHGNVPDSSAVALILMDVINDLEFPGGEDLVRYALPMAHRIVTLKTRAKAAHIPVIYVNDNFGRWRSDRRQLIDHCLQEGQRGKALVELLCPEEDDYFVLKPKHSGFFSTTLDTLLEYLGANTLILAGVAGNICILFTANDAYMRDFTLYVPADCVASNHAEENAYALHQMETILKADITPSTDVDLARLIASAKPQRWSTPRADSGLPVDRCRVPGSR